MNSKTKEQEFIELFERNNANGSRLYNLPVGFRDGGGKTVLCRLYVYEIDEDGYGDGVFACFSDCKGSVGLDFIRSNTMQKGFGTQFMYLLCGEADKAGVMLRLDPYPQVNELKVNKLKQWYKGFGFKPCKGKYIRRPNLTK